MITKKMESAMASHSRPTVIFGNWKMYKTIEEAKTFISKLAPLIKSTNKQVGLAVPFTTLAVASHTAKGSSIAIGAQNIFTAQEGAFTGEISGPMLVDAGASFVLVGHSERRTLFHENDVMINAKVKSGLLNGLKVVFCIGETLEEHRTGKTNTVLEHQIKQGLKGITAKELEYIIIAYEPVWAIGTGQTATPPIAQAAHHQCRQVVAAGWGRDAAMHIVIQYGGSVKPDNAETLLAEPDIDGFLIGGAALSLESFAKIIQTGHTTKN